MKVNCHQVSKVFKTRNGDIFALENIGFQTEEQEFMCILGPSGCGKTTLLRIIAGVLEPTSGIVSYTGVSLQNEPRTALVFQEHGIFPWLNVMDNVCFGLEMRGLSKRDRYDLAMPFISKFGLSSFSKNYPGQLSSGMKQRVGLARAFVSGASILLMDEPFAALDAQMRFMMQQELLEIFGEYRKSVIYVTHDIEEAISLADRILLMTAGPGKIKEEIKIDFNRPRDARGGKSNTVPRVENGNMEEAKERSGESNGTKSIVKKKAIVRKISREFWLSIFSVLFIVILWELGVDLHWITTAFLVSPSEIFRTAIVLIGKAALLQDISITLIHVIVGFIIGAVFGLVVGLFMGWSKVLRVFLNPWVSIIYPLPKVALLPLILLIIGTPERSILLLIALGAFFPVLVNTAAGVVGIDQIYFDVAQNYGARRLQFFTKVMLPGSLPFIFVGFRLAMGISLLLAVIAELAVATEGLGAMLWVSWQTLRIERIYVAIVIIAILGLLFTQILKYIEEQVVPWREKS